MNAFIKIGLPWAFSIGTVFYLGLYFGSKATHLNKVWTTSSPATVTPKPTKIMEERVEGYSTTTKLPPSAPSPAQAAPSMPPNLQRILQGGDIVERLGAYLDAVRSMDPTNVKNVVQAFEELPSGYGRHLEMKLLMRSWANFDPEGALAYASNSLDAKSERRFGISEALAGWAVKDEKAAISWAQANHSGNEKGDNPLLVGIIKGLMETDLDAANRLFLSLPGGTARWQASSLLADRFTQEGSAAAIKWVQQYPKDDSRMRETLLGQIGAKLARQDLEATSNWAKTMQTEPGAYRVTENLIAQWTPKDPQAVATWVNELQDAQRRKHAMAELSAKWSTIDPVATAQWLNSQPLSPDLDPAIASFVSLIQGRDPEGATGWAHSITDPAQRKRSLQSALNAWKQTDPDKANAWLKENK